MSRRRLAVLGALFLCLIGRAAAQEDGTEILERINAIRAARNLHPLVFDEAARTTADLHAGELAARRLLSHQSRDGSRVGDRYRRAGGTGLRSGENLGAGDSISSVVGAWLESPSHRRNMLSSSWTALGAGQRRMENGRLVIVAVFTNSRLTTFSLGPEAPDSRSLALQGIVQGSLTASDVGLRVDGEIIAPSRVSRREDGASRLFFEIPVSSPRIPGKIIAAELVFLSTSWQASDLFLIRLPEGRDGGTDGA